MAEPFDLQSFNRHQYDCAKWWWAWANAGRVGTYAVGLGGTLIGVPPLVATALTGALAVAAEVAQWRSDVRKDEAEDVRRTLDLWDGLGWAPTDDSIADLEGRHRVAIWAGKPAEDYFASVLAPGPRRRAQTARETAFFPESLARTATSLLTGLALVLLAVSLVGLLSSVAAIDDAETLRGVANAITSTLLLVQSANLVRLGIEYGSYRDAACRSKERLGRVLRADEVAHDDAVHLAYDYFIARAKAPLLPGWIYGGLRVRGRTVYAGRREELNQIWDRRYGPSGDRSPTDVGCEPRVASP